MDTDIAILSLSFFIVAIIYSSVGFGGGSSYLALMSLFPIEITVLRPTALLCNIVVVASGTLIFYRQGWLKLNKCWPFLIASIPMAYLGGYYPIRASSFFIVLSFTLIAASILLWFQHKLNRANLDPVPKSKSNALNLALGGGIGFLSGLVSIGGGIFLSPVLHLMNWDKAKAISAIASFFILVNSISGLAGQFSQSAEVHWPLAIPLLAAVFAGGQIGSRLGTKKFDPLTVKRVTAVVILIAGAYIFITKGLGLTISL